MTTGPNVRPGEKPPEFPALAKRHTATGALAFAIYYFKAFDWGLATNDPYLVQQISERGCDGCRTFIRALRRVQYRNETLHGGRLSFDSASIFHGVMHIRADYAVDVAVNQQAVVIAHPGGASSTASEPDRHDHSLVFVDWRVSHWMVVEVTAK